ncbi:MAG: hypothetical protein ACLGRW_03590 [Acidobacteriota bacterium]
MNETTQLNDPATASIVFTPAAPAIRPGRKPETSSKAALRRCRAAYQRALHAALEATELDINGNINEFVATLNAREAFINAMPTLSGYESIRDFIACTAQGLLMDAIPPQKAGPLLYAAQLAISALNNAPKPQKPRPA